MALFSLEHIKIGGLAVTVPECSENNSNLANLTEQEKGTLITTTGIETRRIANTATTAADLCISAAERILGVCSIDKKDIDVLVFVTQTPDHVIPGSSMFIQQNLGLSTGCVAIDINQGCAGYVYGLSVIGALMSSAKFKKGLLLVGDTITKTIAKNDSALVPIFSDAGSCTVIEYDEDAAPIYFNLQTDGSGYDKIIVKGGGSRILQDADNGYLYMNGQDIFSFGLKEVGANIEELFHHFELNKQEIDYFVMHQANMLLNETIRKKVGVKSSSTLYSLREYGNTSCASIPVTLAANAEKINEQSVKKFLLTGFGVGLSWGSALVEIDQMKCLGVDEYR